MRMRRGPGEINVRRDVGSSARACLPRCVTQAQHQLHRMVHAASPRGTIRPQHVWHTATHWFWKGHGPSRTTLNRCSAGVQQPSHRRTIGVQQPQQRVVHFAFNQLVKAPLLPC